MDARCSFRSGGFIIRRSCGNAATGQCVYCAEHFCGEHGTHGEDYYEVCRRRKCRAKWEDLAAHKEWVARHYHDNLAGYCAADECEEALEIPCERCQLRFCLPHVRPTTVKEVELMGGESIRSLMLCPHCEARRKLWD